MDIRSLCSSGPGQANFKESPTKVNTTALSLEICSKEGVEKHCPIKLEKPQKKGEVSEKEIALMGSISKHAATLLYLSHFSERSSPVKRTELSSEDRKQLLQKADSFLQKLSTISFNEEIIAQWADQKNLSSDQLQNFVEAAQRGGRELLKELRKMSTSSLSLLRNISLKA